MLTRHANELLLKLDRVVEVGCAEVRKDELLKWYNHDRLTVGIWRDVLENWSEVLDQTAPESRSVPLLIGEAHGRWILIWGEGVTCSPDSWIKDVRALAKRNDDDFSL